jgi:hypothetical protein
MFKTTGPYRAFSIRNALVPEESRSMMTLIALQGNGGVSGRVERLRHYFYGIMQSAKLSGFSSLNDVNRIGTANKELLIFDLFHLCFSLFITQF